MAFGETHGNRHPNIGNPTYHALSATWAGEPGATCILRAETLTNSGTPRSAEEVVASPAVREVSSGQYMGWLPCYVNATYRVSVLWLTSGPQNRHEIPRGAYLELNTTLHGGLIRGGTRYVNTRHPEYAGAAGLNGSGTPPRTEAIETLISESRLCRHTAAFQELSTAPAGSAYSIGGWRKSLLPLPNISKGIWASHNLMWFACNLRLHLVSQYAWSAIMAQDGFTPSSRVGLAAARDTKTWLWTPHLPAGAAHFPNMASPWIDFLNLRLQSLTDVVAGQVSTAPTSVPTTSRLAACLRS